ncbi:methanogenesis marker 7 protein [Methanopyrus sp. KOL6]|uniref:methanogenesis marker 7 protein n=1 Tax=Methanopyrus sp. KOL6 TaxID=1937004 RepID=UPI000B4C1573|nr:methanogenesis marker 7 protein [Methanopyrus sp. KOL6]
MFETVIYEGGVYKADEMRDLVEDLGGFVLSEHKMQLEVHMVLAVPVDDLDVVERKAEELLGEIRRMPLAGTEIAVVGMSLARHHMPHPVCDIAEYLRRHGAKSNVIGLARGYGRELAQLRAREKRLLEEHDLVIFVVGNFKDCIEKYKLPLVRRIERVPVVVVGGPEGIDADDVVYVGGVGRKPYRFRKGREITKLDEIVDVVSKIIEERRQELAEDPPAVPPMVVKDRINRELKIEERFTSPMPITLQLDGLRVKAPYDEWADRVAEVKVFGWKLREIADIRQSEMDDHILVKIKPKSAVTG